MLGIDTRVTIAGYIDDAEIDDYLAASDVGLCMRWPTSRETSASWLRCLAAGKPTISTDLVHTVDVPTLDPRNWALLVAPAETNAALGGPVSEADAIGVSIDILDEMHSLKLAMRRLGTNRELRSTLGANAQTLWANQFRLETMVEGYQRVIARGVDDWATTRYVERAAAGALAGDRDRTCRVARERNPRSGVPFPRCRLNRKGARKRLPG